MKLMAHASFAFFAVLILSACGAVGPLEPRAGQSLPVKAYAQTQEQSADRLLRTDPQARPNREAEILSQSTIRTADPFDLPPEGSVVDFPDDLDDLNEAAPSDSDKNAPS